MPDIAKGTPVPEIFATALVRRARYLSRVGRRPGLGYDEIERNALEFTLRAAGVDFDAVWARLEAESSLKHEDPPERIRYGIGDEG